MPHIKKLTGRYSLVALLAATLLLSNSAAANEDDQTLLKAFHKYGVTKCDRFILEHGKLKGNWSFNISRHPDLNDKNFAEVSGTTVTGKQGDTVKVVQSFIQTPSACYMLDLTTITSPGHCSDNDNIDQSAWYVKDELAGRDYKKYENKGGITLYGKEITVGNFSACVMEYEQRTSAKIGK